MRSANDWAALKKAERDGHEAPGTYERLWQEEQDRLAREEKARRDAAFNAAAEMLKKAKR